MAFGKLKMLPELVDSPFPLTMSHFVRLCAETTELKGAMYREPLIVRHKLWSA